MTVETVMNQPEEKNSQKNPGEKGWACYYCGKEGHLKRSCSQASKLPPASHLVCKGSHQRRDCPQRCRLQGSGSQDNQGWRCPQVPTQAPILITPWILITGGGGGREWESGGRQSVNFLLDTGETFSVLIEAPGPLSSRFTIVMGLSGRAKCYYFSDPLSCNWDSLLFPHEFLILPDSPSPLMERDILGKFQVLFSWIWSLNFLSH